HALFQLIVSGAQDLSTSLSFDGVTKGTLQQRGVELSLGEIVGGAGLHRLDVQVALALSGQQDDRALAASLQRFAEQLQAGSRAKAVIEQIDVVPIALHRFQSGSVILEPSQLVGLPRN